MEEEPKMGRPTKYKPEYAAQAKDLCLLGATDAMLAEFFDVHPDSIKEWKNAYPEFRQALQDGKLNADAQVAAALFKRAIGFSYDETTYEKIDLKMDGVSMDESDIKTEAFKRKVVTKMLAGDVNAQLRWLSLRQRDLWRENDLNFSKLTDEQLDIIIEKLKKQLL